MRWTFILLVVLSLPACTADQACSDFVDGYSDTLENA